MGVTASEGTVSSHPAPGRSPGPRGTVPSLPTAVAELHDHRRIWWARPLLRSAYADAWAELFAFAAPGPSLEIGCGCGSLDGALPRCWKSDIVALPWADLAADALRLPVRTGALANIAGTDVLHHLPRPFDFLAEAVRALRPGGRLLLLEPFMSRLSYPVYRYLHHEPADLGSDPGYCAGGNQALPTLLLWRHPELVAARAPRLEIIHCRPRDAIVYPLSGGYSYPPLLPRALARAAWRVERRLRRWMPAIGFRLAIALRRREGH
ncbi:MAG TPA: methyltransferase domain-containing protein [Armatimonadota bacterium]|nr:methyltransferase domain-containing protein [Armatimonadota bacterium]